MWAFPHTTLIFWLLLLLLMIETNGNSYDLNEANWKLMLKDEWMVQFVAPWCPSCKIVAPIWKRFEKIAGKFNVKVGTVDITKSPSLSGRFFVTSLPSIYHVIDGKFRFYRGQRDINALTAFIKLEQWKDVAPISRWNNPNAYHMGILSYFFRIALVLKEWNARLQEELGFSPYSSYGIFVLGTILFGAIFGLILLRLLELLCPSKTSKKYDLNVTKTLLHPEDESKNFTNKNVEDLTQEGDDKDSIDTSFEDYDEEIENENFTDANVNYATRIDLQYTINEDEENSGGSA